MSKLAPQAAAKTKEPLDIRLTAEERAAWQLIRPIIRKWRKILRKGTPDRIARLRERSPRFNQFCLIVLDEEGE